MKRVHLACALAALVGVGSLSSLAFADDGDYSGGPIIKVISIRTADGHFEDYMHFLATTTKKTLEAYKKAGVITAYRIILLNPQEPSDPDILEVMEFKNWAAFDSIADKIKKIPAGEPGSAENYKKSKVDPTIRRVLGERIGQEAILK